MISLSFKSVICFLVSKISLVLASTEVVSAAYGICLDIYVDISNVKKEELTAGLVFVLFFFLTKKASFFLLLVALDVHQNIPSGSMRSIFI